MRRNVKAGLKILRGGLTTGDGDGWVLYGDCYRFGYSVENDVVQAVRCYSKAGESFDCQFGVSNSHFALAEEMFGTGDGLARNMAKAVHHYVQATNRMNQVAQWKAGNFYELGTEVEEHIQHAFYYFDLSARGGHAPGIQKARDLYMKGIDVPRERTKGVQLLEEAVKRGDPKAKGMLRKARRSNLLWWNRRSNF